MRSLNANALAKIAQRYGNEAIIILDIAWTEDSLIQYADRDIESIKGKILDVSNLDNVVNIAGSADSQELSVVLDDTDGTIKNIIDTHDIHKRDVWVYQWFEGLALTDRFLLFKGKINSPIIWNEGDRTVSFSILAQIEDREVGFSPEEGMFDDLPQTMIGQAWPLVFGYYRHVKAVRITNCLKGISGDGVGWADPCVLIRSIKNAELAEYITFSTGQGTDDSHHIAAVDLRLTYNAQLETERDTITILNGEKFPRGNTQILLNDVPLNGSFSDNIFTIDSCVGGTDIYDHPNAAAFFEANKRVPHTEDIIYNTAGGEHIGYTVIQCPITWSLTFRKAYSEVTRTVSGSIGGENMGYVYCNPGSSVALHIPEPQKYIISIVPGEVRRVVAWVQKDGQRFIRDIPEDWYAIYTETYGPLEVKVLILHDAISKREDEGFEDEIFVTYESTIGPNTVDILEYLINTYSDFTIDPVSFANVKTRLANYPSNFVLYDRKNIVTVLQEIAWQARCAIYLKNGIFYLLYLPEEQTSVDTIYKSDILVNTFELQHTPTEDLVTKMVCTWNASGVQEEPYKTILRHNVTKYGTQEQTFDYYIYDYADYVIKSATFWLIRYSNTWKKAHFQLPLTKLNLETFDAVTLDLDGMIADTTILTMIEKANYNSLTNNIDCICWCPVKIGTMEQYIFAYPADVDEHETFPTAYEIQEGYIGSGGEMAETVVSDIKKLPEAYPEDFGLGYAIYTGFNLESVDAEPISSPGDEYKLRYPMTDEHGNPIDENGKPIIENRAQEDKGDPTPGDAGDSSPGTPGPIENPFTQEARNPGPDSPVIDGGEMIPPQDGYGGTDPTDGGWNHEVPPGPGSANPLPSTGSGSSSSQNDLEDLPDAERADMQGCAYLLILWVHGISSTMPPCPGKVVCGCCNAGPICTADSMSLERIVFSSNEEALEYKAAIEAIGPLGIGGCGGSAIYWIKFGPGSGACGAEGEGPQAYSNSAGDGAFGAGAWLDGSDSTVGWND